MSEKEIKKFKRFLKEEGIFKLFIRRYEPKYRSVGRWFEKGDRLNSEGTGIEAKDERITDYLSNVGYGFVIFSAFEWGSTQEGFDFWKYVNNKWVRIPSISYAYEY